MTRRVTRASVLAAAALLVTAACGQNSPEEKAAEEFPGSKLQLIAPAAPGGGWDGTARALQKAIDDEKLAKNTQVVNIEGSGGTIGLTRFVSSDDKSQLLIMGGVMVGAIEANNSKTTLEDAIPVARLTSEYHALVVPKNSKFKTLADFTKAFKADPSGTSIGGGSKGGTDHITAALYAEEIGSDPKKLNYIGYSGGGEALANILGGKVTAGLSNINEWRSQIESGDLRVLAVSSPERLDSVDAETFVEQGVDVVYGNWRGIMAPPSTTEAERKEIEDFLTKVTESKTWQELLKTNGWEDEFLVGDELDTFFDEQAEEMKATLKQVGLA